jgi:hypothetical protein
MTNLAAAPGFEELFGECAAQYRDLSTMLRTDAEPMTSASALFGAGLNGREPMAKAMHEARVRIGTEMEYAGGGIGGYASVTEQVRQAYADTLNVTSQIMGTMLNDAGRGSGQGGM